MKPSSKNSTRTQAQRSETTRQLLLEAAIKVLIEKGYAGFRTADVALAAGISRGALTHHFPTKDELVLAALEHVFRKAADQGKRKARQVRTVDDAIAALLADSKAFFFSDLFLIAVDLTILGGREFPAAERIRDMSRTYRLPLEAAWLDALVALGVPSKSAEDLLWLTISIVRGLAVRRLLANEPRRFERLLALWREMVVNYLRTGIKN